MSFIQGSQEIYGVTHHEGGDAETQQLEFVVLSCFQENANRQQKRLDITAIHLGR